MKDKMTNQRIRTPFIMMTAVLTILLSVSTIHAFTLSSPPQRVSTIKSRNVYNYNNNYNYKRVICLYESTTANAPANNNTSMQKTDDNNNDDDDDEWEYEEFDVLGEADFYNSEWKVGTLQNNEGTGGGLLQKEPKIEETWCRLLVDEDGQQTCVWGDGAKGKWNFDTPSQFLSMSKDTIGGWFGKKIWAGTVDDYYYLQGTVRGWSPISPASVDAQWQARRLGIDKDEAGIAPWFEEDDEEDEEKKGEDGSDDEGTKALEG